MEAKSKQTVKNFFIAVIKTLKAYLKNYWWKLLIVFFLLAVDIVTKSLIVKFDTNGEVIKNLAVIIDNVLYIMPTANEGAAWSILSGKTILLIILTFIFLISIICYDLLFKKKSVFFGISTSLIVTGAIGNLIDRLAFGKVRDFIYFSPINFPVFNVADMCLTVGIILFAIYTVFIMDKNNKKVSQKVSNGCENSNKFNDNEITDLVEKLDQNQKENIIDKKDNIDTKSQQKIDNSEGENGTENNS